MNKKVIISLVLIGIMAFGVSLGTYAYFTSTATSSNNTFTTGTLKLNGTTDATLNNAFSLTNQQPGVENNLTQITITNDGTLASQIKAELAITDSVIGAEGNLANTKFMLKPVVTLNGQNIYAPADYVSVATFKTELESRVNGLDFAVNDVLAISGKIKLDETAQNNYQNATLSSTLTIRAKQTNATTYNQ